MVCSDAYIESEIVDAVFQPEKPIRGEPVESCKLRYFNSFEFFDITSFNEWREDTDIEPTIITGPTTRDTSPSGIQYTQGLVYQGFGTTYLDILREELANAP